MNLAATVRLRGVVLDARVVPVRGPFLVGAHPDALVPFPGVTLPVAPVPAAPHPFVPDGRVAGLREPGVAIGGVVLVAGSSWRLQQGDVDVEFSVERSDPSARWQPVPGPPLADLRLLVGMAAVVLFGLWFETAERWVTRDPEVVAEIQALPDVLRRARTAWGIPVEAPSTEEGSSPEPDVRVLPVDVLGPGITE
jgi:hypothetical protein